MWAKQLIVVVVMVDAWELVGMELVEVDAWELVGVDAWELVEVPAWFVVNLKSNSKKCFI